MKFKNMKFKPVNVAVLGPEGTFSEIASKKFLADECINGNFVYCNEVDEIFELVENQNVSFGVVPLENSIEGSINLTIDCLREYYKIVEIYKDIILDVRLCLLAKKDLEYVSVICSHPHAIAQCRKFLKKLNRNNDNRFKISTVKSTALACKIAKDDETVAAAAAEEASEIYRLNLLFKGINDYKSQTRFIVIKRKFTDANKISGKKISLIFELENKPGALYEILREFSEKDINLTKIESRPSKRRLGEYFFFLEFEGNLGNENTGEVIKNIKGKVKFIEILGNY
ncbi:MAG: prephenate dehydratase [Candidatus Altiarchaeum hamiconexum]|uniref:prephenate dehydratase n=1 Tax=Candidatus Altarchaeum hamiconexum TaxID=1803513 RepID=A0A8J7YV16_9ARCH|nr:prephenate dehydratase [Candidatus Altarchaeum hamiconexum]PIN68152.1 MAG: prephenate dehydratase [Candidatus Altarchaeum sp. CG12_big_fil_rev_8_21_14_0_65_33_22]PIV28432.1 MAG: prephenate dehydratase [Candidatus Altarchaeum sp. CG03_land_8_20_14_0_80_32_618]PIX49226.1 MAG: prephenate dehydratase [Candidatus Altarchaeum sp. CG_4_8_14_3_um_filter_33_2054]PIZ30683.1 MAG: prephenate dehydratase [Candidatus Altarchaeum sp. CG_4_10_14_0_8_um_filter_32_851]PJC15122.1 MAG: prephenate dehydratase [